MNISDIIAVEQHTFYGGPCIIWRVVLCQLFLSHWPWLAPVAAEVLLGAAEANPVQ